MKHIYFALVVALLHCLLVQPTLADSGYHVISPLANKPVTMDLQDVGVQSALAALAQIQNVNVAFQRDVDGQIRTLQVSGVPASEIFEIILRTNGLYAERSGNVIIVYPIETFIRDSKARKALQDAW